LEGLIARARGEEQPLVFVAVPQYPYLAQLTFQMRLESFDGSRRQADGSAALLGLRFPQFDDPAIACERAPDAYGAVLYIHVLPSQCQQLSLPHSGGNGEDVQGF